jgi:DNA topoisomerase-1
MKTLLIVESPAKSKTIEKLLGSNYIVLSSFGHIRNLDKKSLGIDVENNFKPTRISRSKKK